MGHKNDRMTIGWWMSRTLGQQDHKTQCLNKKIQGWYWDGESTSPWGMFAKYDNHNCLHPLQRLCPPAICYVQPRLHVVCWYVTRYVWNYIATHVACPPIADGFDLCVKWLRDSCVPSTCRIRSAYVLHMFELRSSNSCKSIPTYTNTNAHRWPSAK